MFLDESEACHDSFHTANLQIMEAIGYVQDLAAERNETMHLLRDATVLSEAMTHRVRLLWILQRNVHHLNRAYELLLGDSTTEWPQVLHIFNSRRFSVPSEQDRPTS